MIAVLAVAFETIVEVYSCAISAVQIAGAKRNSDVAGRRSNER
jgi:hypothetical protein